MFAFRNDVLADGVGVAFSDAVAPDGTALTLAGTCVDSSPSWALVRAELGVPAAVIGQVHSTRVVAVDADTDLSELALVQADALVTAARGIALAIRVADCVPVVLADAAAGVAGVAHAGRVGLTDGVLPATVEAMRALGAARLTAWIGPHICAECYEVPADMRTEVATRVPGAWATTSWGTPALDLGSGAERQLCELGCEVRRHDPCTMTTPTLHSYRRDGATAGRMAAIGWLASVSPTGSTAARQGRGNVTGNSATTGA